MEITLISAIMFYICTHIVDLSSALEFRRVNRKKFEESEDNTYFKKMLNNFKLPKAILLYELTYELQYLIMFGVGVLVTFWAVFGEWNLALSIPFFLIFRSIFHCLGAFTNIFMSIKHVEKMPWEADVEEKK